MTEWTNRNNFFRTTEQIPTAEDGHSTNEVLATQSTATHMQVRFEVGLAGACRMAAVCSWTGL